jgi:hypothetical protein
VRYLRLVTIAGALATAPVTVTAQTGTADGVAALARGEYQRAAEILRPIAEREGAVEPAAQFFLGSMYDAGLGVPQDRLRACALYHRAGTTNQEPFATAAMRLHKAGFRRHGAEFLADCTLVGNLGFDHRFEPVTFELAPGHSIAWDLRGATISYRGSTTRSEMRLAARGAAYLPLRYTPLYPADPKGMLRHFVEVFLWQPGPQSAWSLNWHLFEVVGGELLRIADDDAVMTSPTRPGASPSEDVRHRVTVRTDASGKAEWAILEGAHARSGPIESDEERREVRELEAAREAAASRVDWTRKYDVRRLPSLNYGLSDGCGNFFVYAYTNDRAEAVAIRVDRGALQLSSAARSFELARHPEVIALTVHVYEGPMRGTMFCTDVGMSPGPVTETWRAVAGRVTIELSPPGVRAKRPSMYRATIRIDGAEFIDSSGRRHRQTTPIVLSAVVGSGWG